MSLQPTWTDSRIHFDHHHLLRMDMYYSNLNAHNSTIWMLPVSCAKIHKGRPMPSFSPFKKVNDMIRIRMLKENQMNFIFIFQHLTECHQVNVVIIKRYIDDRVRTPVYN